MPIIKKKVESPSSAGKPQTPKSEDRSLPYALWDNERSMRIASESTDALESRVEALQRSIEELGGWMEDLKKAVQDLTENLGDLTENLGKILDK